MLAVDDHHDDDMFKSLTLLARDGFIALDAVLKYDSAPLKEDLLSDSG